MDNLKLLLTGGDETLMRERHPECFRAVDDTSPRGKTRTVPMECLNLSFNRTGTAAMADALNILGLPAYHSMLFFGQNHGDIDMWLEAMDAKFRGKGQRYTRREWDQLLHNVGAISADTPMIAFSEDLIQAYPEAKVVLIERDIDSWYKSYNENVIGSMNAMMPNLACAVSKYLWQIREVQIRSVTDWLGMRVEHEDMRRKAKQAYIDHYAHIRRITPSERLLEYRLEDGWEPLCRFLGKPVPDRPFPQTNDAQALQEKITLLNRRGFISFIRRSLFWLLPVVVAVLTYRWFRV